MKHFRFFFPAILLSLLAGLPLKAQTDNPQALALPDEPVSVPEWLFNTDEDTYPGISNPNPDEAEAREQAIGRALMLWTAATGQTLKFDLETVDSWTTDRSSGHTTLEGITELPLQNVRFSVLREMRLASGETVVLLQILPDGSAGAEERQFMFQLYFREKASEKDGKKADNREYRLDWGTHNRGTLAHERDFLQEDEGGILFRSAFNAALPEPGYTWRYAVSGTPYPYGTFGEGSPGPETEIRIDMSKSFVDLTRFRSLGEAWGHQLLFLGLSPVEMNYESSFVSGGSPDFRNQNVTRSNHTAPCQPVKIRLAGIARQQLHLQIER